METIYQHLIERHLDIELHRPFINEDERLVSFLLWNLHGRIMGYQRYRPDADKMQKNNPLDGRYFTRRRRQTIAVWGLESFYFTPDVLFITEGIFDAARLTKLGYSAIAVMSNDPCRDTRNWINSLARKTVVICDPGKAGAKLAKCGDVAVVLEDVDLGDSTHEKVLEIIHNNT